MRSKVKQNTLEPLLERQYLATKYEQECPLKSMVDDIIDQKEDRLSLKFIAEVVRSREKIPF